MTSSIPVEVLDDLSSRFVINIPSEEKENPVRLLFQIEQAHWYYLDFLCGDEGLQLRRVNMKEFTAALFKHIPFLHPHVSELDTIFKQWRDYKQAVPTFGLILLDEAMTHVVLVQGYHAKASWGFPKGKVNMEEGPCECAAREVLEETGFDASRLIDPAAFLETEINYQKIRLYIVTGISRETKFEQQTRCEIRSIEWFALADIPSSRKDLESRSKLHGERVNTFYMVTPFLSKLKQWISEKRQKGSLSGKRQRHRSVGDICDLNGVGQHKKNHQSSVGESLELTGDASQHRKAQQRFTNALMCELNAVHKEKVQNNTSPLSRKEKGTKTSYRRQLFTSDENWKGRGKSTKTSEFHSPSWLSFKFDRRAIMASMEL